RKPDPRLQKPPTLAMSKVGNIQRSHRMPLMRFLFTAIMQLYLDPSDSARKSSRQRVRPHRAGTCLLQQVTGRTSPEIFQALVFIR
ncbi:MAG: hypothetical protein ACK53L_03405, partial [Pirellulaceae bacterium]